MLELRIKEQGRELPLFALPALLGRAGAAERVGDTIDALLAFMDDLDGDTDLEDDDPAGGDIVDEAHDDDDPLESDGDDRDASFTEWRPWDAAHPVMRRGFARAIALEDAEEDDHSGSNGAEDDFEIPAQQRRFADAGPGCIVSDNATAHDGSEDGGDTEINGDELDGSDEPDA